MRPVSPPPAIWPVSQGEFANLIAPLGPFEPAPALAVAVSGGADSTALALLADHWARAHGGICRALIVDHALRPASAAEASLTAARLATRGIPAEILPLTGLAPGPGLAARARLARHAALAEACRRHGILHLLLAHHAGDQAETVLMRQLARSGPNGLAGIAGLTETHDIRLLRPLLATPPGRLRATLHAAGMAWVEDPSNSNPAAQRARLRTLRRDPDGTGEATIALVAAAAAQATVRAEAEHAVAAELAVRATLHPAGFALLTPGPLSPAALGALLAMLAGAGHTPSTARVTALAASPRPATLAGVRLIPAGRAGPPGSLLLLREAAAMAPAVPATDTWDGRFRLHLPAPLPPGASLGPLGAQAAGLRRLAPTWPAALLHTLPALRIAGILATVPHLRYDAAFTKATVRFCPRPACGAAFHGSGQMTAG